MTEPRPLPVPPPSATTLRARCPEDVLAAVPVVLGFEPTESLVMMTFGGHQQFHARADLPPADDTGAVPQEAVDDLARTMLDPALRHRVRSVVLVVYSGDEALARRLADRLLDLFEGSGIHVADVLRAHAGRWFSPGWPRPGAGPEGSPYDARSHPFRAQAVLEGRVTLGSRAELEASVRPRPELVAETTTALRDAEPLNLTGLERVLARGLDLGGVPDPDDRASLLLALADDRHRDRLWSRMDRPGAQAHVRLWLDVVRGSPEDSVAHPAALLAFAAWLAGDGALAWCAVDRCVGAEPAHRLGGLVGHLLTQAVPPSSWEESRRAGGVGGRPVAPGAEGAAWG